MVSAVHVVQKRESLTPCGAAVCGGLNQALLISVRDNGDGTCTASLRTGTSTSAVSCTSPVFQKVCDSVQASVALTFARQSAAVPYSQSMGNWLNLMGIGNATVIAQPLTITVEHAAAVPVPQFIAPIFFQRLSQVMPAVAFIYFLKEVEISTALILPRLAFATFLLSCKSMLLQQKTGLAWDQPSYRCEMRPWTDENDFCGTRGCDVSDFKACWLGTALPLHCCKEEIDWLWIVEAWAACSKRRPFWERWCSV